MPGREDPAGPPPRAHPLPAPDGEAGVPRDRPGPAHVRAHLRRAAADVPKGAAKVRVKNYSFN